MSLPFIPVNEPLLDGNEKAYLAQCIDSGWISSEGPFVAEFESRLAERVQRRHGVAVTNGTAALDAAIEALGIGPGDEVILPSFTIISCILQLVRCGATPVLVDSDPQTWNMDTRQIEARVTPRTRAILVVHTYGLPVDMDPVLAIAARHGLRVIEDAAEAIGLRYRGQACGSFGDISTFSFYPNKHLTTGEGGMVVTNDDALADACRGLRNLCFQPARRFVHERLGWNLRMTNLQAALGLAQLERLDEFLLRKRAMGARYNERLQGLRHRIDLPLTHTAAADNNYWVYGIVLKPDAGLDATELMKRLAQQGIGTRPFFWPMHEQPVLLGQGLFSGESHPVAENLARRGLYLPSGLSLTEAQIDRASDTLHRVLG
jgi:perosamine synthetase